MWSYCIGREPRFLYMPAFVGASSALSIAIMRVIEPSPTLSHLMTFI